MSRESLTSTPAQRLESHLLECRTRTETRLDYFEYSRKSVYSRYLAIHKPVSPGRCGLRWLRIPGNGSSGPRDEDRVPMLQCGPRRRFRVSSLLYAG